MISLAQRWRRAIASLADPGLRAGYMRSELLQPDIEEVADALDEISEAAERAETGARDVIAALAPSLSEADLGPHRDRLRALALSRALAGLHRLLRHPDTRPETEPPLRPPKDLTAPGGRPLTLGERKALARRPTRKALDTLMRDPHPLVVRNLLGNPRLTEDDVVRMAARRPGRADALAEIGRNPWWMLRPRVRMALVLNPATPPEIALTLVRLLRRPELSDLLAQADVAPLLRKTAADLLARRNAEPEESPPRRDLN